MEERFAGGSAVALLRDGRAAFPAMLEAIERAERQVLLEMYWFASDRAGERFVDALCRAAARGVEVALLYDSVGSFTSDDAIFARLRDAGARVVEFNPIAPWRHRFRFDLLTRRDHRKILVVDERVGFTGGINIAAEWLPEEEEGRGWRDDAVRLEGPCVHALADCFHDAWRGQQGPTLEPRRSSEAPPCGNQKVRVLGQAFFRDEREIVRAYLAQIWQARERVWIANSYFVPDGRVVRALRAAAARGVDVRVIVPGTSDVEIVRHASRAVWGRLLRQGVRIFRWNGNILHAKTAVVDGIWSTIGTFNLDYLSLRSNLEVNVAVRDEAFARTVEASFERDFEKCSEVDPHDFKFRSLGDRLLEMIFYRLRKLL